MVRWITKDSPGYAAEMEKHRRYQEYHRRKNDPIRKAGPMTSKDYETIVRQAPQKAANIISNWKERIAEISGNPVIPEAGQLHLIGEATQEALNEIQKLNDQQAVAADLARKALAHNRDQAKPKVDADTWSRKARQFEYLVDRGVSLDALAAEIVDPVSLRIAQDEMPVLARGLSPLDPKAGEGVAAQLAYKALSVYGNTYQAKADELSAFEKGAYRAQVAMTAALRQIRNDDRGEFAAPAYQDGQLVEA